MAFSRAWSRHSLSSHNRLASPQDHAAGNTIARAVRSNSVQPQSIRNWFGFYKLMTPLIRNLVFVACCLTLSACDGPLHFLSGGELSGAVADVPDTWQLKEPSGLAQLETRPGEPYSINLAYVQLDGRFYFYAGDTRTNWVKHIEENPLVRVRVNDTIYPGRAVRVTDEDEIAEFAAIWVDRSMFSRDPNSFEEVWLYRLVARP